MSAIPSGFNPEYGISSMGRMLPTPVSHTSLLPPAPLLLPIQLSPSGGKDGLAGFQATLVLATGISQEVLFCLMMSTPSPREGLHWLSLGHTHL